MRRALASAAAVLGSLALLTLIWQLALSASPVSDYLTRTPIDVLTWLFIDSPDLDGTAASRRSSLLPMIAVTLHHAGIGLLCGVSLGLLGAIAMSVSRTLRSMFLPIALVLQTVPLIAMAPVVYAVFGSGIATAAVIAGIVTFFPLLVNTSTGLGSASEDTRDLVRAYGGGWFALLTRVQLPAALPYLFAGLKIAAPATVSAATLYEFLFSFEGLGANLLTSRSYSNYGLLWTLVVVTVALALVVYGAMSLLERAVLAGRFPPRSALSRRGGTR